MRSEEGWRIVMDDDFFNALGVRKRDVYNTIRTTDGQTLDVKRPDVSFTVKKAFDQAVAMAALTAKSDLVPPPFQGPSWRVPGRRWGTRPSMVSNFDANGAWVGARSIVDTLPQLGGLVFGSKGEAVGTGIQTVYAIVDTLRKALSNAGKESARRQFSKSMIPHVNRADGIELSSEITPKESLAEIENVTGNDGTYDGAVVIGDIVKQEDLPFGFAENAGSIIEAVLPANELLALDLPTQAGAEANITEMEQASAEVDGLTDGSSQLTMLTASAKRGIVESAAFGGTKFETVNDLLMSWKPVDAGEPTNFQFPDQEAPLALSSICCLRKLRLDMPLQSATILLELQFTGTFISETVVRAAVRLPNGQQPLLFTYPYDMPTIQQADLNRIQLTLHLPVPGTIFDKVGVGADETGFPTIFAHAVEKTDYTLSTSLRWDGSADIAVSDWTGPLAADTSMSDYLVQTWETAPDIGTDWPTLNAMPGSVYQYAAFMDSKFLIFNRIVLRYLLDRGGITYLGIVQATLGMTKWTQLEVHDFLFRAASCVFALQGPNPTEKVATLKESMAVCRIAYLTLVEHAEELSRSPSEDFLSWMKAENANVRTKAQNLASALRDKIYPTQHPLGEEPPPPTISLPVPGRLPPLGSATAYARMYPGKGKEQIAITGIGQETVQPSNHRFAPFSQMAVYGKGQGMKGGRYA